MNTITTAEPLVISRLIKAPRERVFAAWTTPEFAQWICFGERRIISAQVDPRVGGQYFLHIATDEGEHKFSGTYREIKAPSRIVFSWSLGDCMPEFEGHNTSEVAVDLEEQKGGTLVTLTHTGLPNEDIREKHSGGWNRSLENLEKLT